jgi:hypothetical protein
MKTYEFIKSSALVNIIYLIITFLNGIIFLFFKYSKIKTICIKITPYIILLSFLGMLSYLLTIMVKNIIILLLLSFLSSFAIFILSLKSKRNINLKEFLFILYTVFIFLLISSTRYIFIVYIIPLITFKNLIWGYLVLICFLFLFLLFILQSIFIKRKVFENDYYNKIFGFVLVIISIFSLFLMFNSFYFVDIITK